MCLFEDFNYRPMSLEKPLKTKKIVAFGNIYQQPADFEASILNSN